MVEQKAQKTLIKQLNRQQLNRQQAKLSCNKIEYNFEITNKIFCIKNLFFTLFIIIFPRHVCLLFIFVFSHWLSLKFPPILRQTHTTLSARRGRSEPDEHFSLKKFYCKYKIKCTQNKNISILSSFKFPNNNRFMLPDSLFTPPSLLVLQNLYK